MEPLRELLGTEKAVAYSLRERREGLGVDTFVGARFASDRFRPVFDRWLGNRSVDIGSYNPLRPEPWQRNVVFTVRELVARGAVPPAGAPATAMARELWPSFDLLGRDQLRVLVCEGPSLLAWVGAFQPDPFDLRQARLLSAVTSSLRRRLRLERQVGALEQTQAALDAALEAMGRAAFILGCTGEIRHANAAGRVLVDRQRARVTRSLRDAVRRRPADMRFELTPLRGTGTAEGFLALAAAPHGQGEREARVALAAARWCLTSRQREVLELLVAGLTNRTIAANLGVSERAVEIHVSAIFDRAGVHSRASLVAKLLDS